MTARLPKRVVERPQPSQWADDELLTLQEATLIFWPDGPLRATSLRTAYRAGQLEVVMIARKMLVTPKALRAMTAAAARRRDPAGGGEGDANGGAGK